MHFCNHRLEGASTFLSYRYPDVRGAAQDSRTQEMSLPELSRRSAKKLKSTATYDT